MQKWPLLLFTQDFNVLVLTGHAWFKCPDTSMQLSHVRSMHSVRSGTEQCPPPTPEFLVSLSALTLCIDQQMHQDCWSHYTQTKKTWQLNEAQWACKLFPWLWRSDLRLLCSDHLLPLIPVCPDESERQQCIPAIQVHIPTPTTANRLYQTFVSDDLNHPDEEP